MPLTPPAAHAEALRSLDRDPLLAAVIGSVVARSGYLPALEPAPDPFGRLVRSVAGQQLSVRAAATIYARLEAQLGEMTPPRLAGASGDELRAAGLSWAKVRTVQALAQASLEGQIDFAQLPALSDEAVISQLVTVPGIGRWTAEMFLMFGLARPDVFSFGDLALRRALERHYGAPDIWADAVAAWSPHRTLAARYLWASGNP
ncbi:DNA-3-methyladenine glycosylase family protein [Deinococcus lacus]|uniref:DNA-3-methyladenine glycosylase II n=1 Tax=Deinococcus lacus TaxID=392561 RepID=A0ABW1YCB7_9DEIO